MFDERTHYAKKPSLTRVYANRRVRFRVRILFCKLSFVSRFFLRNVKAVDAAASRPPRFRASARFNARNLAEGIKGRKRGGEESKSADINLQNETGSRGQSDLKRENREYNWESFSRGPSTSGLKKNEGVGEI